MKPRHTVLLAALLALPVAAGGDRIQNDNHSPSVPAAPAFSAGQVLILDSSPAGQKGVQALEVEAALGQSLSTSTEGLVVEKSPVPGGGKMVNLQGRFQNAMTASVDADGHVSVPCVSGTPKTDTEVK